MEDKRLYNEEFIIHLTIVDTSYNDVEIRVSDPNKTIQEQINSIMQVFGLSKAFQGHYVEWRLGQDDGDGVTVFDCDDSLLDYHVQTGDSLQLIHIPLCGVPFLTLCLAFDGVYKNRNINGSNGLLNVQVIMDDFVGTNINVECFAKHLIEMLHLPLFSDGYIIKYTLSYWDEDSRKNVKCDTYKPLREYLSILINQDKNAEGKWRMGLFAEKTKNRNHCFFLLERLNQTFNRILNNNCILIN